MQVTLYHNPRCSKSRQTLALLQERGIQPKIIKYLETPPNREELKRLLTLLQLSARELIRTKEAEYRQAILDDPRLDDDALIDAMLAQPKLIERPIVVAGNKAAIGRPPENILEILP